MMNLQFWRSGEYSLLFIAITSRSLLIQHYNTLSDFIYRWNKPGYKLLVFDRTQDKTIFRNHYTENVYMKEQGMQIANLVA